MLPACYLAQFSLQTYLHFYQTVKKLARDSSQIYLIPRPGVFYMVISPIIDILPAPLAGLMLYLTVHGSKARKPDNKAILGPSLISRMVPGISGMPSFLLLSPEL